MCPHQIQGTDSGSPHPRLVLKVKEEGDIWSQFGLQRDSAGCRLTGMRSILAAGPQIATVPERDGSVISEPSMQRGPSQLEIPCESLRRLGHPSTHILTLCPQVTPGE